MIRLLLSINDNVPSLGFPWNVSPLSLISLSLSIFSISLFLSWPFSSPQPTVSLLCGFVCGGVAGLIHMCLSICLSPVLLTACLSVFLALSCFAALFWFLCPGCYVLHGSSVLVILFWLFYPVSPVRDRPSCPERPFLAVLFRHSCSNLLVLLPSF